MPKPLTVPNTGGARNGAARRVDVVIDPYGGRRYGGRRYGGCCYGASCR